MESIILILTTPFCGTCKLAVQMAEIVREGNPKWRFAIISTTDFADLFRDWQIESVPCILIMQGVVEKDRWYRIGSVPELWQRIAQHM
jgi:thioredoxin 1